MGISIIGMVFKIGRGWDKVSKARSLIKHESQKGGVCALARACVIHLDYSHSILH